MIIIVILILRTIGTFVLFSTKLLQTPGCPIKSKGWDFDETFPVCFGNSSFAVLLVLPLCLHAVLYLALDLLNFVIPCKNVLLPNYLLHFK